MFNNPFREEALVGKNQRQQLASLLRITAPHERIILACIGLALLALAAWALLGSVSLGVTVDGVLIKPGNRHEVVATEPGHLVEFLVAPGDRVAAGDPIARQSVPELDRETAALRSRVDLLQADIEKADRDGSALRPLLDAARVALLQMEARRSARALIVSHAAGEVMALRPAPGDYLTAGAAVAQLRDADAGPLHAVLSVAHRTAQRIQAGMPASIEVAMPNGATRRLDGEVAVVAAGALPDWLAGLWPSAGGSEHRVDVLLDPASDLSMPDGTPCRIRIVLGPQPPAALIDLVRS